MRKEFVLTPSENFILSEGLLQESDTREKMPFCLLMNKLNIITQVLFLPLMEGLQEEIVHFLYDSLFHFFAFGMRISKNFRYFGLK